MVGKAIKTISLVLWMRPAGKIPISFFGCLREYHIKYLTIPSRLTEKRVARSINVPSDTENLLLHMNCFQLWI